MNLCVIYWTVHAIKHSHREKGRVKIRKDMLVFQFIAFLQSKDWCVLLEWDLDLEYEAFPV